MGSEHNIQKKIALVSDMTGFGRCAAAVQIPVISMLKVQCCLLPTSILSNHTAFPEPYIMDFTPSMQAYIDGWKKIGLEFEGISTGFLASAEQADIICGFIEDFRTERTQVIVDPVMGDHGKAYRTCTPDLCGRMARLVTLADIALPNVTEACILTDSEYREDLSTAKLTEIAKRISDTGPSRVVITGIPQGSFIANLCYEREKNSAQVIRSKRIGASRFGTGDIFSAIVSAGAVNSEEITVSVRKAASFIRKCLLRSEEMGIAMTDGVCFEEVLGGLIQRRGSSRG